MTRRETPRISNPAKTLSFGVALVLIVILINALVSVYNARILLDDSTLVNHTQGVLMQLETTLSLAKDAETGQRGYLLTGRTEFLKPYYEAQRKIESVMNDLQTLVSDNRQQLERMKRLRRLWADRLGTLQRNKAIFENEGRGKLIQSLKLNEGKNQMDALRDVVKEMENEERGLLDHREDLVKASVKKTIITFVVVTVVTLGLLLAAFETTRRRIIERNRAAEALYDSEQRLLTTLNSIGDAMIATDGQGRVTMMNPVAEELTGWKQADAKGIDSKLVFNIVNESTRKEVESPVTRVIREGVVVGLANHTILISKEGGEVPIDDSGAPIRSAKGDLDGVVLVFRDISERKKSEEALHSSFSEIEELNVRLRRAMTETHHRVKNNLQLIAAMVDLQILAGNETISVEEFQRLGTHVRTLAVVHDILTKESKEDGEANFVSARAIMTNLLSMLESSSGGRRIVSDIADLTLTTRQSTSLALVINELVSNAVKYGKGDIQVSLEDRGEIFLLSVCDDGPGFPPDFDVETFANTGLELVESVSRWDLNGQTRYENLPEGGARVFVTIGAVSKSNHHA